MIFQVLFNKAYHFGIYVLRMGFDGYLFCHVLFHRFGQRNRHYFKFKFFLIISRFEITVNKYGAALLQYGSKPHIIFTKQRKLCFAGIIFDNKISILVAAACNSMLCIGYQPNNAEWPAGIWLHFYSILKLIEISEWGNAVMPHFKFVII